MAIDLPYVAIFDSMGEMALVRAVCHLQVRRTSIRGSSHSIIDWR